MIISLSHDKDKKDTEYRRTRTLSFSCALNRETIQFARYNWEALARDMDSCPKPKINIPLCYVCLLVVGDARN